ncbi:MAG: rhamnulokinase [Sedimentisphaerales bacterium]|nr:rhamnulokinase [Sedimentisphaerales bacterium]
MMSCSNYIAVDLGAESGRVMLAALKNNKITLTEAYRFSNGPIEENGSLKWDFPRLIREIKTGIAKALDIKKDVRSIGVDTWGVDFGLIDKEGNLLENPYHYRDERNVGMIEKACRTMPKKDIYFNTGIQLLPFNSLYQLLAYKEYKPQILEKASKLLLMPNLIMYHLTGQVAAEYSMASTSQIMDMRTGNWSDTILNAFGLPKQIFPEITRPGTNAGRLKKALAAELGCTQIPVVTVGCHDTASAVAGVPAAGDKNWAYLSSGTWSLLGIESDKPIINDETFEFSFTNEGGVFDTIRLLKNIMGLWPVQQCRTQWLKEGCELDYSKLTEMAAVAEPFRAYIDIDAEIFLSMGNMPQRINTYLKSTGNGIIEDKGQIIRVILESLAIKYCQTLGKIEKLTGRNSDCLYIVGGGSQNRLLNQFTADATARKVIAGPVEATVLGNVLVQAVADGSVKNLKEGRKIIAESFPQEKYQPQNRGKWQHFIQKITES